MKKLAKVENPGQNNSSIRKIVTKEKFPLTFLLSLSLIFLLILYVVYRFYLSETESIKRDKTNDLISVADLKVKLILDWRTERLADGKNISGNKIVTNEILAYARNRTGGEKEKHIIEWFKSLCDDYNYTSVRMVDTNANLILSYKEKSKTPGENVRKNIIKVLKSKKPLLSDIHFYESTEEIHLDLVIPLISTSSQNVEILLLLEINPYNYIYPLIQTWTSDSKTSETLLIEKDGDDALYLNDLRLQKNTALRLRKNISEDQILAVKAIKGITGYAEGIDYVGYPVIGIIRPVPGTDWFLICKVEKKEIFGDINIISIWAFSLLMLLILLGAGIALIRWQRIRGRHYKKLYESEQNRLAIVKHFEYVMNYANDIILLFNENGKVIEANERALSSYGYTRNEILELRIKDIRAPSEREKFEDLQMRLDKVDGLVFETIHIRKDGTEFPVEASARLVKIDETIFYQSIIRDITERKQTEEALKEREFWLRESQRVGNIGSYNLDIQANKWTSSEVLDEIFGIERDSEKTLESWNVLTHPEHQKEMLDYFLNYVVKGKNPFNKNYKIVRPANGEVRWVWGHGELSFNNEGTPLKMFGTIQDITELKQAEIRIQCLNRLYAFLSEVNQVIVRADSSETLYSEICRIAIEYGKFNMAWIGLKDEKTQKIIPAASEGDADGYFDHFNISDANSIDANPVLYDVLNKGRYFISNDISKTKLFSNRQIHLLELGYKSLAVFPFRQNGRVIGTLNLYSDKIDFFMQEEVSLLKEICLDISFALDVFTREVHRKEIYDELISSEKKFRSIFENASDAILLLDDNKFIEFNKSAEELYGYSRDELLYKTPYEVSPKNQLDGTSSKQSAMKHINAALNGEDSNFEWLHIKPDSTVLETEVKLNPVTVGNKKMLLAVVYDITERKKYEAGLKEAKEKAEEISRLKTSFLANMSHELRTPMTGILGFAEILQDSIIDPAQKQMAEAILKGGKRLTNTLNLILDLSKIEAEALTTNISNVNISDVIRESMKLYEKVAKNEKLDYDFECEENLSAMLDSRILSQILNNLIKNAVIYTKKGSVRVKLQREKLNDIDFAVIKVIDTGIGIPEELQEIIFEPFRQVSEGLSRHFEGTGLGLTITKKFVELMEGTISVQSKPGKGTEFTLKFIASSENDDSPKEIINEPEIELSKENFTGKKLLLVEDDESSIFTVQKVLSNVCDIDITDTGIESIELSKKNSYTAILMDIGLKGMNGLEAAQEIRKISGYEKIPIVAFTAYAMEGDKERFLEGGCTHYLSKPFTIRELKEIIAEIMG
ncbi:MAG TPA: PAS domain S-box protein [Ignavibacteria bacterium]